MNGIIKLAMSGTGTVTPPEHKSKPQCKKCGASTPPGHAGQEQDVAPLPPTPDE